MHAVVHAVQLHAMPVQRGALAQMITYRDLDRFVALQHEHWPRRQNATAPFAHWHTVAVQRETESRLASSGIAHHVEHEPARNTADYHGRSSRHCCSPLDDGDS